MIKKKLYQLKPYQFFLLIGFLNTIFFALLAIFLPISFEDNDDVLMLLFASGRYTGSPEAHLVFINYLYGLLVSSLYSITTHVEWYTLLFSVFHILSVTIISKAIIDKNISLPYKLLFLLLLYAIEVRLILYFQFTTTAALMALGGCVLLLRETRLAKKMGVLLLFTASLIRFEAAVLVVLVMSPVFISFQIKNKKLPTLIYILVSILLSSGALMLDHAVYKQDSEWMVYKEYNRLRGNINDNPNRKTILNDLPASISLIDYNLLLDFMPDAGKVDLNALRQINAKINNVSLMNKAENIRPAFVAYYRILGFTVLFVLLAVCFKTDKQNRLIVLSALFIFLLGMLYVSLDSRFKYRVFLSGLLPLIFVVYNYLSGVLITKYIDKLILFVGVLYLLLFSVKNYQLQQERSFFSQTTFVEQKALIDSYLQDKNNSIVPYGADFNLDCYPPFKVSLLLPESQIFLGGWATLIPYNSINFYTYKDIVNQHAIFFDKGHYKEKLSVIMSSLYKNYKIKSYPKIVAQSENYIIVKIETCH